MATAKYFGPLNLRDNLIFRDENDRPLVAVKIVNCDVLPHIAFPYFLASVEVEPLNEYMRNNITLKALFEGGSAFFVIDLCIHKTKKFSETNFSLEPITREFAAVNELFPPDQLAFDGFTLIEDDRYE